LSEQTVTEVVAIGAATATDDAIAAPTINAEIVFKFFMKRIVLENSEISLLQR
jgi:hypothetical protein